jgi:hypothetical protein
VLQRAHVGPILATLDKVETFVEAVKIAGTLASGGTVNPAVLAGLLASTVPFGNVLSKAGKIGKNSLSGVSNHFSDMFRQLTGSGVSAVKAAQHVGELGGIAVARKLGFDVTDFPFRYHGIDGVMRAPNGRLVIIEAKGGTSGALGMTKRGEQISRDWIDRQIAVLRDSGDPLSEKWADQLFNAKNTGQLDVISVFTPIKDGKASDPVFDLMPWQDVGKRSFRETQ